MMKIRILTVGKKHEAWVKSGVERFLERLRGAFAAEMEIIPHSSKGGSQAVEEESGKILGRLSPRDFVILLDERGQNISSPELAQLISVNNSRPIVIIIGGAYGVSQAIRQRADFTWSLSRLVFPHQMVRLILAEQLYRAQEISHGGQYHHD